MAILEAISKRYSCRSYEDKPLESGKLDQILQAARLAPSARNIQDWRFVVVTDPQTRAKVAEAANGQMFLAKASAVIVACSTSDNVMRCGQRIAPIDISIALEHIALQAADLDLATCWIGSFFPEKVKPILGIPDDVEIIELMALGYPADKQQPAKREPLEKIVCYDKWQF